MLVLAYFIVCADVMDEHFGDFSDCWLCWWFIGGIHLWLNKSSCFLALNFAFPKFGSDDGILIWFN